MISHTYDNLFNFNVIVSANCVGVDTLANILKEKLKSPEYVIKSMLDEQTYGKYSISIPIINPREEICMPFFLTFK